MPTAKISIRRLTDQISNTEGQTMIETVIALAVVMILVSSLVSMSIASVRSASLSRNKNAASQLAYRESELIRVTRDGSLTWADFTSNVSGGTCTTSCYVDPTSLIFSAGSTNEASLVSGTTFNIYLRQTNPPPPITTEFDYTVYVTWSDSAGSHTQNISSILTPWK